MTNTEWKPIIIGEERSGIEKESEFIGGGGGGFADPYDGD